MADVSVNMGVSGIAQFKQGMSDAQASVKTFDAALKANEKQLRATGDAESFMQAQTTLLNGKLREQQNIAKNAEQAMKQMEQNGVKTTSRAYQEMQRRLIEAQSGMMDTQMELDNLGNKAADATGKTDQLATSLGGLNKKVSLDQVRAGIGSITNAMEQAARKAVELGKALWDEVMDSARWADDTATMAQMYGIDIDTFQRMQKLVTGGLDTTVESMLQAQDKLKKGIGNGNKQVKEYLTELGLMFQTGKGSEQLITDDTVDLFFRAGQAILAMGDAYDQEAAAQALFGRGWKELVPLFEEYKTLDEYNAALGEQTVVSEKAVKDLVALNEAVAKLEGEFKTLERETIGALAPGLTAAADALSGLLGKVLEYLDTPEGKKALEELGTAVEGLFKDLESIDPAQVVEGFTGLLETVVGSVQWLVENKDTVIGAMEGILAGWAVLKVTGGALDVLKIITGIKELASGTVVAQAASGLGNILTTAAGVALKAAPWLAGLALLFENAIKPQGNDDLIDENGNVTELGKELGLTKEEAKDTLNQQKQIADSWEAMQERTGLTEQQVNQLKNFWSFYKGMQKGQEGYTVENYNESWANLQKAFEGQEDALRAYAAKMQELAGSEGGLDKSLDLSFFDIDKDGLKVPVIPEAKEGAKEDLEAQIGELQLVAQVKLAGFTPRGDLNMPWISPDGNNANGIWSVPFDGYMSVLHKGERVVPAREVNSSQNFSSNLYVESMYMNNGMDAEGLAAAMAAANRRTMRGFGS